MPLKPSEFWNGKLPVGTRCRDAVTGKGPYYILPLDPDEQGRVAVYGGSIEPDREKCMGYHRMWIAALKPERPPVPRDWDKLSLYFAGGAFSSLVLALACLI